MSRDAREAASEHGLDQVLAAVNDELVAALRRADALRAESEVAREAVQSAAEERLRFFQYANHDMRSPLTVLLGQIELTRRRVARGDYQSIGTALETMEIQVRRLIELTDRSLRLTRTAEAGTAELEEFDLAEAINESVEHFTGSSPDHRITAHTDGPLLVEGQPREFDDVLENLIANAVKYSSAGGSIEVSATAALDAGRRVARVSVTDEGQGIPEEHRSLLFEPFYRAPGAGEVVGNGLGLAICADIVARHGGRIWLERSSEEGSTFVFVVPLTTPVDD